jgi:hypothetical protein
MFTYVVIGLAVLFIASYSILHYAFKDTKKFIDPLRLILEATIVGVGLTAIFSIVHVGFMKAFAEKAMVDHKLLALQIFIAGALFHGLFEITTGNHEYCNARISK